MVKSFRELVRFMEDSCGDRTAVRFIDGSTDEIVAVSYGTFAADIRECAGFLQKSAQTAGKRLHFAVLAENCYEYLVYAIAAGLCGAVIVPLNRQKEEAELLWEIRKADVSLLIFDEDYRETACSLAGECRIPAAGIGSFHGCGGCLPEGPERPEELFMILFTSGTTGIHSKGVMHSQRSALFAAEEHERAFEACVLRAERNAPVDFHHFIAVPFFHIMAYFCTIPAFLTGRTVDLCLDMKHCVEDLQRLGAHFFPAVPAMVHSLCVKMKRGRLPEDLPLTAFFIGGAPVDREEMSFLLRAGYGVINAYGLTESFGSGAMQILQDEGELTAVGKAADNPYVSLCEGEFRISGDGLMPGYYGDPELTAEAFDSEGRLRTGDLGMEDGDGYLHITGRKKNLIILSNGENVNPEELEAELLTIDTVTEALVCEKDGKISAVLYCRDGGRPAAKEGVSDLNGRLPPYKRIMLLEFRDSPFPKTETGKIKRGE